LTDNSLSFNQSRHPGNREAPLERYLKTFGVKPISGQVQKPTTQGKNERLHQTLQKFLEAHRPITSTGRLLELLDQFADGYNNDRPHQELPDYQTPAEAYTLATKANPPEPPPPVQQDLFDAAQAPDQRPTTPVRRRPDHAEQIGGLLIAHRKVSATGYIAIANCQIQVGKSRRGQTLHISITDDHLELFSPDGDALGIVPRPPAGSKRATINLYSDGIYCG
jgi:hypothetical protein